MESSEKTVLVITQIDWVTEGQRRSECDLPESLVIHGLPACFSMDNEADVEDLGQWLADKYGFSHGGFCADLPDEIPEARCRLGDTELVVWDWN